ncbi:MAG TPA: pitrilysin family protein [Burkholderiales bacterium]|nr:pitrilysin family protein [Burkholderiales bacterium]
MKAPRVLSVLVVPALLAASQTPGARVRVEHWSTQSGARAYFVETHALPIVDVSVEFAAGGAHDPRERAGLGQLTLRLLKGGSARYSEEDVDRRIADVGAQLRDNFDLDRAGFALRTLSSEAERTAAVDTLADILQAPRFANDVFEREKARAVANAAEAETQPDQIAEKRLYALMYPAHPYGWTATPATLSAIAREDVERHYRDCYTAGGAALTIVGDLSIEAAKALAERLTSRLARGGEPALPPLGPPTAGEMVRIAHPSAQSHVLLGEAVLTRDDPDYFPLLVGNYILGGGGFSSRLMTEVRSKHGLAYSVYSYFYPFAQRGPFEVGLQTRRDQADEALRLVQGVISEFVARGPTAAELKAAKQSLVGGFPLRIDTNRKLLEQLSVIAFYQLPLDWLDVYPKRVEAVTLAQIRDAFARRVPPEKLATVVVGAAD